LSLGNLVLGGKLPRWLGFDIGPLPLRGTRATVHQGQTFGAAGRRVTVSASYRLVADFAEDAAHSALPGGPSERRTSRWYASGIRDWLQGRLKTLRPGG
jgi:penicillin amidase